MIRQIQRYENIFCNHCTNLTEHCYPAFPKTNFNFHAFQIFVIVKISIEQVIQNLTYLHPINYYIDVITNRYNLHAQIFLVASVCETVWQTVWRDAIFSIDFIAKEIVTLATRRIICEVRTTKLSRLQGIFAATQCLERREMGREDSCSKQWLPCGINESGLERRCVPVTILFCPKFAGGHEPPRFHHPDIYRSHSVFLCAVLFHAYT